MDTRKLNIRKPNILLIMDDQHRFDMLGYKGIFPVQTPSLDRLASEGLSFNRAYTPIPICCPARQEMLMSKRVETMGAYWNFNGGGLPAPAMEPENYSWPRELQKHGYRNTYIGKWHIHPTKRPDDYGFDDYVYEYEYVDKRRKNYPQYNYTNNDWNSAWKGEDDRIPLELSETEFLANKTIDAINNCEAENWFITLSFPQPHLPCRPCSPFSEMYDPDCIPKWGSFDDDFSEKPYIQKQQLVNWTVENTEWEDWKKGVARYYALITQVDAAIGRVLDTLRERGEEDNTIIIFTSDHGDMCGSHRMVDKHYVMYDDIVRVPYIFKYGKRFQGESEKLIYNTLDLGPTILDLLNITCEEDLTGRSIFSSNNEDYTTTATADAKDQNCSTSLADCATSQDREYIVSTYNGQQFGLYNERMITDGRYKYIWNTTDVDEFYDTKFDRWELNNRIHDSNVLPIISIMRKALFDILQKEGDLLVTSPWLKKQLLEDKKI